MGVQVPTHRMLHAQAVEKKYENSSHTFRAGSAQGTIKLDQGSWTQRKKPLLATMIAAPKAKLAAVARARWRKAKATGKNVL
jgi:hypothetical protein